MSTPSAPKRDLRKIIRYALFTLGGLLLGIFLLLILRSASYPVTCELRILAYSIDKHSLLHGDTEIIGPSITHWGWHEQYKLGYLDQYPQDPIYPVGYFCFTQSDASDIVSGLSEEALCSTLGVSSLQALDLMAVNDFRLKLRSLYYLPCN